MIRKVLFQVIKFGIFLLVLCATIFRAQEIANSSLRLPRLDDALSEESVVGAAYSPDGRAVAIVKRPSILSLPLAAQSGLLMGESSYEIWIQDGKDGSL